MTRSGGEPLSGDRVEALRELHEEKFRSIGLALDAAKISVDEALAAARDSVGEQNKAAALALTKSEGATNKQLDGLNDKIDDLKQRMSLIEGSRAGSLTFFGALIGAAGLIAAVLSLLLRHS